MFALILLPIYFVVFATLPIITLFIKLCCQNAQSYTMIFTTLQMFNFLNTLIFLLYVIKTLHLLKKARNHIVVSSLRIYIKKIF